MSQILWTAEEARMATAGRLQGRDWTATGVSIDSRSVAPGDLFVAVSGPNHDGHDFVAAAIAAGAAAAMVSRVPAGLEDAPLLVVEDTVEGLYALARASRARSQARIVAVTGSVGKTGTKEMLAWALSAFGPTHASAGNLNNHLGAPLSLSRMPRESRFAVFELGMNHPGEIAPLTRLVRPHVAVVTSVEAVHSAHFSSTEQIADAKAEIFLGLEPGGIAVLPRDNPHFRRLAAAAEAALPGVRVVAFGSHIDADARLLDCGADPDSTAVLALVHNKAISYRLGISGAHWATNSLAVLLAVQSLGPDMEEASRTLRTMSAPKGRGMRQKVSVPGGTIELIDETYNASPVSMKAALATLAAAKPAKGARRIAVLGDMLELGEQAPSLHAGLAEAVEQWRIDLVFTSGPLMRNLFEKLPPVRRGEHAPDSAAAGPLVKAALKPGDVVMVKGSAGSRMGRVISSLCEG